MSDSELRESFIRMVAWERSYANEGQPIWQSDLKNVIEAARRWLAEHDETPVDEAWLLSIGFKKEDHPQKMTILRNDAMPVSLWKVDDGWKAMLIYHEYASSCIVRGKNTRGDVRRLCQCLGITIAEPHA